MAEGDDYIDISKLDPKLVAVLTDIIHIRSSAGIDNKITIEDLFGDIRTEIEQTTGNAKFNNNVEVVGQLTNPAIDVLIDDKCKNWDSTEITGTGGQFSIVYSSSLDRYVTTSSSGLIFYSSDLQSWTSVNIPGFNLGVMWAAYSETDQRFVVVSVQSTTDNFAYSSDGINWTLGTKSRASDICYSEDKGLFVTMTPSTNQAQYSSDGINWNTVTIPESNMGSVAYSEKLGMFVARGSTTAIYSYDGINWSSGVGVSGSTVRSITASETLGIFLSVGVNGDNIQITYDGINWSGLTSVPGEFRAVCYSETLGRFMMSGVGNSNNVAFSTDAINWEFTTLSPDNVFGFYDAIYNEYKKLFVMVHNNASDDDVYYTT